MVHIAEFAPATVQALRKAVSASPLLQPVLQQWGQIALPDAWLSGSALAQTLWNVRFGFSLEYGISDLDLVYFDDKDLGAFAEERHSRRITELFQELPVQIDLKNQARVHLWYAERFGYDIAPYLSSRGAIATFPTTASAVGIRPSADGLEIWAPFGLDDLIAPVVRANRAQITQAIYEAKQQRWRTKWPELKILPWGEGNG